MGVVLVAESWSPPTQALHKYIEPHPSRADHLASPQTTYSDHILSPQQKSETIPPELYILPRGEASAHGGLCRIARARRRNYITRIMGVHSCVMLRSSPPPMGQ